MFLTCYGFKLKTGRKFNNFSRNLCRMPFSKSNMSSWDMNTLSQTMISRLVNTVLHAYLQLLHTCSLIHVLYSTYCYCRYWHRYGSMTNSLSILGNVLRRTALLYNLLQKVKTKILSILIFIAVAWLENDSQDFVSPPLLYPFLVESKGLFTLRD